MLTNMSISAISDEQTSSIAFEDLPDDIMVSIQNYICDDDHISLYNAINKYNIVPNLTDPQSESEQSESSISEKSEYTNSEFSSSSSYIYDIIYAFSSNRKKYWTSNQFSVPKMYLNAFTAHWEYNQNFEICPRNDLLLLHTAIINNSSACILLLLDLDKFIFERNNRLENPLHLAVLSGSSVSIIQTLLLKIPVDNTDDWD